MNDWTLLWNYAIATQLAPTPPTQTTLSIQAYMDSDRIERSTLQNGRLYYFAVRLTNSLSQYTVLASNGECV